MNQPGIKIGNVYRHWKNKRDYIITALPMYSGESELSPFVVYQDIENGKEYTQPLARFFESVNDVPRFTLLADKCLTYTAGALPAVRSRADNLTLTLTANRTTFPYAVMAGVSPAIYLKEQELRMLAVCARRLLDEVKVSRE